MNLEIHDTEGLLSSSDYNRKVASRKTCMGEVESASLLFLLGIQLAHKFTMYIEQIINIPHIIFQFSINVASGCNLERKQGIPYKVGLRLLEIRIR